MSKTKVQALFKKAFPNLTIKSLFNTIPTEHEILKCIKYSPKQKLPSKKSPFGSCDILSNEGCPSSEGGVSDRKVIICAEFFPPAVAAFARSLDVNIILLDAEATYTQILAPKEIFPEIKIETKRATPRKTLREIKTMVFGRHRTKSYIVTGAIILLSSLIIRLHIYYIIVATIVFGFALASHFSPRVSKNLLE